MRPRTVTLLLAALLLVAFLALPLVPLSVRALAAPPASSMEPFDAKRHASGTTRQQWDACWHWRQRCLPQLEQLSNYKSVEAKLEAAALASLESGVSLLKVFKKSIRDVLTLFLDSMEQVSPATL